MAGMTDKKVDMDRLSTDQTTEGTRPTLNLSENAIRVLEARYLKKDKDGVLLETADDMFRRVARTVASMAIRYGLTQAEVTVIEDKYYDMMVSGQFMPNSPTLMNAGREMGMLSACFVLPVKDSVEDIFESIKHTALIQKAGGGTGFAFDELRPTGDFIKSSGGTTSGPISFWRAFSEATNAIQQGAFRRGANMGMMYIHHPDILKFIHAKQDLHQFNNYNISVKITDAWMEEFLADENSPHVVRNPRSTDEYYIPADVSIWDYTVGSLIPTRNADGTPNTVDTSKLMTKKALWNIIVKNAHATGEPGVIFIDEINRHNPTPHIGRIEATNPCGEQPLLPYEACNLGSINVGAFARRDADGAAYDWQALGDTVDVSVQFLDDVIDANRYPLPQIDRMCKANRKIGLGVMGFADALFQMGIGYNTEQAVEFAKALMKFINERGHDMSERLARERGCFPNWQGSVWDVKHNRPMRNAAVTTIAPTGTISMISNCSSGIEPLFSLVFYRNVLKEQKTKKPMLEVNEYFLRTAQERKFYSEELMKRIAQEGSVAHCDEVPADVRKTFVCAHDIEPIWHLKMQAAFQSECDSSISKTINFPHDAKIDEVDQIYRQAFAYKCKGITVYRDGCRSDQPMATEKTKKAEGGKPAAKAAEVAAPKFEPVDVPECLPAIRVRQMTPFGHMHVSITVDPKRQKELEVFAQLGKGGDIAASDLEAICRMISLFLRSGGALKRVINQLQNIGSSLSIPSRDGRIMSLGDGLSKALARYQRAKERFGLQAILLGEADLAMADQPIPAAAGATAPAPAAKSSGSGGNGHTTGYKIKCPECGGDLTFEEGCVKCHGCGYAQC